MRIAYLDCASGISGDMTLGALVDAGVDLAAIQAGLDSLAWPDNTPNCRLTATEVKKKGFRATQVTVEHEPEHAHRHLHHIQAMIDGGSLTPRARELATAIFRRIAEAEAKVHGSTLEKVHFHEVGAIDSIADIVGAAIGWDLLGVDAVYASPVPTGSGFVQIAHGRCAIPAPATAELLAGVPLAEFPPDKPVVGELTTPTGAAIVKELARGFGPLPAMTIERIGYGAGQKDFDHPNLLRLVLGEKADASLGQPSDAPTTIVLLETNLDDTPGEAIGDCVGRLRTAGALDASLTPLQMKKDRPGVLLSVQASPADADALAAIVFRHTTALGLRRQTVQRIVLPRRRVTIDTPWGEAAGTVATLPDGGERFTPEYDDCKAVADAAGVPLTEVTVAAAAAWRRSQGE
ncbi:nickel pincer cofactor biosynthesis protein LarC [Botrimarina sp.]|uniref:nickel pincer cofactor biosynthesis protein LarC n=1 Tax=Botrimarina sp. TaxID=2795802 RepID=UPI0032EBE5C2